MRFAASRTFWTAGRSRPIRMAMMAMTTNSSISVNAGRRAGVESGDIGAPRVVGRLSKPSHLLPFDQRGQVPDLHRLVAAPGVQPPTVGAERQAADQPGVPAEAPHQLPGPAVPDLDRTVLPPGGDPPAGGVRAERHRVHVPAVPPEGAALQLPAGLHVPDLDRVLRPPGRQPPAVRAEGDVQARPR